jgi:UPF0271 protein
MTEKSIDLNSDLGEGFGAWKMADDAAMLDIVSSANIACGGHAGDPVVMARTLALAAERGVSAGAHVGYPDLAGFGRRPLQMSAHELEVHCFAQLGALSTLADAKGMKLTHANFHGALGNLSFSDPDVARVLISTLRRFNRDLAYIGLPHTATAIEAERQGVRLIRSFLADRAYTPSGRLVSRQVAGSVIHDPDNIAERVRRVLEDEKLICIDGTEIDMTAESILIHSDTQGAIPLAGMIRNTVEKAGFVVKSFT